MIETAVQKRFRGFSLETAFTTHGGCLGILGASGCGKSMTLRCIAGIERPDAGRVVVNGRVLYDSSVRLNLPPQKRRVGYLFQNYALFPRMTVAENIVCGMRGEKNGREQMIRELLARFHLEGLGGRYPGQLSGGQQQRAALARMLASEPDVILLDEPFSALDAHLREQMQMQVLELLESYGKDAVLVTHSRDEAYRLCGELLVMDAGRPIAHGGTKELFRSPGLVQVARLTGCKNISRAKKAGAHRVEALDWGISLDTADPVPEDVSHVGVRAHSFFPPSGASAPNLISIEDCGSSEGPFEWNILFRAAGTASEKIWWKISKHAYAGVPDHLAVSPEDVLVLREG